MSHLWFILKTTFTEWNEHEAPRRGAALAFYTVLSLAPLVIVAIAIGAFAYGRSAAQSQLLGQVQEMIGSEGAEAVKSMLVHQKPTSGIFASTLGVITLLLGASGVFGELQGSLNRLWDVQPKSEGGLWGGIKARIFSVGMMLAAGLLLLVSLVASAVLAALGNVLLPLPAIVLQAIDFAISFCAITALFALMLRYVPSTRIAWRNVWIGGAVTAILFTLGKFVLGLYLGKAAVGSAYGAAGSLVVVIVWLYYSAMIFLFGAEFTHVLASPDGYKAQVPV